MAVVVDEFFHVDLSVVEVISREENKSCSVAFRVVFTSKSHSGFSLSLRFLLYGFVLM